MVIFGFVLLIFQLFINNNHFCLFNVTFVLMTLRSVMGNAWLVKEIDVNGVGRESEVLV